jgi:hypothetical protein
VTAQSNVSITPASAQVQVFHPQQFSATVNGSASTAVNWAVNGAPGGNLTVGQIDSTGLYTAPNAQPSPSTVTISATSQTDSTQSANASVAVLPDAAPPAITSVTPVADQTDVALDSTIQVQFNDSLDPSTVNSSTFTVTSASGTVIPASVAYSPTANAVTLTPAGILSPGVQYTVTVSDVVADPAGKPIQSSSSWSFTAEEAATANGTVPTSLVSNPTTLTVVSYGGAEATPDSNGQFSASVTPLGNSLVSAMLPGKNFGWMAFATDQSTQSNQTAVQAAYQALASKPKAAHSRPVFVTKYQITSSAQAASNSGAITTDATTTAESLVFLTPYFYTSNPTLAASIQMAIAQDPNIPALAQALQLAQADSDPIKDVNVQAALQKVVLSVLETLVGTGSNGSGQISTASAQAFDTPKPLAVQNDTGANDQHPSFLPFITPNCYVGTPSGLSNCLDLKYLQFSSSSPLPDSDGNYDITVNNCWFTHANTFSLGCSTNWLIEVAPITNPPSGGAGSISPVQGSDGQPASPPNIYDPSCTQASPSAGCFFMWIPGASTFDQVGSGISSIIDNFLGIQKYLPPGGGPTPQTFAIPGSVQQDYIVRAYSGGFADSTELMGITQGEYNTDSLAMAADAFLNNAFRATTNFDSGLTSLVKSIGSGGSTDATPSALLDIQNKIEQCVVQDAIDNDDLTNEISLYESTIRSGNTSQADLISFNETAANDYANIALKYKATCAASVAQGYWDDAKSLYSGMIWEAHAFLNDPNSPW